MLVYQRVEVVHQKKHEVRIVIYHKPKLPSGKHTKNCGQSPFLMGKSTISTGPCSSSQIVLSFTKGCQ